MRRKGKGGDEAQSTSRGRSGGESAAADIVDKADDEDRSRRFLIYYTLGEAGLSAHVKICCVGVVERD